MVTKQQRFLFDVVNYLILDVFAAENMTNQNVVVASDRKFSNIGLKITVTLTNSTLFSGADSKALPAPGGGFITISRKNILRKPTDTTDQGGNKINAWVNSLRASSPTRLKSSVAFSPQTEEQTSWIVSTYLPTHSQRSIYVYTQVRTQKVISDNIADIFIHICS